jgi:hypothetical protein
MTRRQRWRGAFAVACSALALGGTSAHAESTPTDDKVVAEALFRTGRELMDAGRIEEACRKFEQSQKLVRAAGTLLNMALCHEKEGRVATAWVEYEESLGLALQMNVPTRAEFARAQMERLGLRIPRVRVEVPTAVQVDGLLVKRNETVVPRETWGVAMPVDPGGYVIRATAQGRAPWTAQLKLVEGQAITVTIPMLEPQRGCCAGGCEQGSRRAIRRSNTKSHSHSGYPR